MFGTVDIGTAKPRNPSRRTRWLISCLAAGAAVAFANSSFAQQGGAATFSPGALVWAKGGCSECHGGIGQGGTRGEAPRGPDLWRARLDREALKETIACGRPATQMPSHIAGAYAARACWGLPLGAPPEGLAEGATLTAADIDALTDFLVAKVIGKAPITRAKCGAFFGDNPANPGCAGFPN